MPGGLAARLAVEHAARVVLEDGLHLEVEVLVVGPVAEGDLEGKGAVRGAGDDGLPGVEGAAEVLVGEDDWRIAVEFGVGLVVLRGVGAGGADGQERGGAEGGEEA